MRSPTTIQIADVTADRSVSAVRNVVKDVVGIPLLNGRLIADVNLADNATVRIPHRLGRKWQGWILTSFRGASTTGRLEDVSALDAETHLTLKATGWGATVTASLWVF